METLNQQEVIDNLFCAHLGQALREKEKKTQNLPRKELYHLTEEIKLAERTIKMQ